MYKLKIAECCFSRLIVNTNISIPKDVDRDSSINASDIHIPTLFPNVDNEEDLPTAKKKKRKSKGRDFGMSM